MLNLSQINEQLLQTSAEETLEWALIEFNHDIAFASSFGAEDMVIIDLLAKINKKARIFTLDTGRLPEETYDIMERVRAKYGINFEVHFPDTKKVEKLEHSKGFYSFRDSIENRKECCRIRKIEPLKIALSNLKAWTTGLRREQAVTRASMQKIEIDEGNGGIYKVNPLIEWSEKDVWDYIKKNKVPYNKLHDQNYPSIGCAPCTRAVKHGEDIRAGRWWWESPEQKECGLHKK